MEFKRYNNEIHVFGDYLEFLLISTNNKFEVNKNSPIADVLRSKGKKFIIKFIYDDKCFEVDFDSKEL